MKGNSDFSESEFVSVRSGSFPPVRGPMPMPIRRTWCKQRAFPMKLMAPMRVEVGIPPRRDGHHESSCFRDFSSPPVPIDCTPYETGRTFMSDSEDECRGEFTQSTWSRTRILDEEFLQVQSLFKLLDSGFYALVTDKDTQNAIMDHALALASHPALPDRASAVFREKLLPALRKYAPQKKLKLIQSAFRDQEIRRKRGGRRGGGSYDAEEEVEEATVDDLPIEVHAGIAASHCMLKMHRLLS